MSHYVDFNIIYTEERDGYFNIEFKRRGVNIMPSVRVASFGATRAIDPLIGPLSRTETLVEALQNPENFGLSGIVKCPILFLDPVQTILPGSLVNLDSTLNADVFFGGNSSVPLTASEAAELAAFINAGGIVFVGSNSGADEGVSYNPLFSALGVTDEFIETNSLAIGIEQSSVPTTTPVTTGPFGTVGPISITIFKIFVPGTGTDTVATGTTDPHTVLAEGAFGKGYLSVAGDVIYIDLLTSDQDNLNYFLNLFALGCKEFVPGGTRGIEIFKYKNII